MKTTFRKRFNHGTSYKRRAMFVALTLVLGIIVFTFGRHQIFNVTKPLWLSQNVVSRGAGNLFGIIREKEALIAENRALKDQLQDHQSLLASYRTLEASLARLQGEFASSDSIPGIPAGVLSHPPQTPYDNLVIDAGKSLGVAEGMKVSLPLGGALGKVSEVLEHESKVTLYSGSGIETPAYLERHDVAVVLKGQGGGTFEISLPRDVAVEPGDRVLLPGLQAELVGIVREVNLAPTDSAKKVIVEGLGNVSSIRFVTIH